MKFINNVEIAQHDVVLDDFGKSIVFDDGFKPLKTIIVRNNVIQGYYLCNETIIISCIQGIAKVILFDLNEKSSTKHDINEFFIGQPKLLSISIPSNVIFCWQCVSSEDAIILTNMTQSKNVIDPVNEDEQVKQLGFAISYKF